MDSKTAFDALRKAALLARLGKKAQGVTQDEHRMIESIIEDIADNALATIEQ